MTRRNPTVLLVGGLTSILIAVLVGVMIWIAMDTPSRGRFNTTFSLVDDKGSPVDQSLFKGSPSLVYFGYTHCPEVCPTTLFEVADYLKTLGPEGRSLKTFFFSVDPERDTPEIMHGYVNAFTDRITGITGAPEEMRKVIDGWKVFAAKIPSEGGDYHMSHTMSLLLIGADGRLKGLLPYGGDKEQALETIRRTLL
jgi:protein SCO1/2